MSEFDTAPAAPAFEREHRSEPAFERYGWCAPAEAAPEPVRPLSADIAREWRAKGQDR